MKTTKLNILALGTLALYGLVACGDKPEPGHEDHDHAPGEHDHSGHDHGDHEDEHEGHDHEGIVAGPNGGRVLTAVEPHAEFFVTDDRKIQITFVDDDLKPVPAADQSISVVAGDRSSPTKLAFEKSGTILVSDGVLPEGNDFPVIVQIKPTADAETIFERFNLNLSECPTCEYKEYACTCEHAN